VWKGPRVALLENDAEPAQLPPRAGLAGSVTLRSGLL
jgi:hypothetical protein